MIASAVPSPALDAEWIVCLGETRIASGGRVPCPLRRGITVLIDACSECHVLAWRSDERDLAAPCTTERALS